MFDDEINDCVDEFCDRNAVICERSSQPVRDANKIR